MFKKQYKKKFSKKPRKATTNKAVSSTVKKYVKKELHRNLENKVISTSSIQSVLGNTGTTATVYYFNMIPSISQGITAQTRIGINIRPMSLSLKLHIWNRAYVAVTNPNYHNTYRILILKFRKQNSYVASDITSNLFRYGGSVLGPQGNYGDIIYPINLQDFKVYADKKVHLSSPQDANVNNAKPCTMDFQFQMNKHLKKQLKYDDTTSTATNDNLFCVMFGVATDGSTTGTTGLGYYTYEIDFKFEDA